MCGKIGARSAWPALLCLAAAAQAVRADEVTHDLRGPGPVKGTVLTSESVATIKDATVVIRSGQAELVVGTVTMDLEKTSRLEILAVDGRQATRTRLLISKDTLRSRGTVNDEKTDVTRPSPLTGKPIVGEWTGTKWKHTLEKGERWFRPWTEAERDKLDDLSGYHSGAAFYPAAPVPVGHRWDGDAEAIRQALLPSAKRGEVTGKASSVFRGLETVGGERCAVIETELTFKQMVDARGKKGSMSFTGKRTAYRSLKSGETVKEEIDGRVTLVFEQESDGVKGEVEISGPMTGRDTVSVTRRP